LWHIREKIKVEKSQAANSELTHNLQDFADLNQSTFGPLLNNFLASLKKSYRLI
jgi:hypothetical protein